MTVLVIAGPIAAADVPGLCDRVRALLTGPGHDTLLCDVRAVQNADAVTVDALARMQLTAKRRGGQMRLRHASRDLERLLAFVGLTDAVPLEPTLVEPVRQAEQREQPRGVEERVEPRDPTA
jgi:anti-anti-sigma factor